MCRLSIKHWILLLGLCLFSPAWGQTPDLYQGEAMVPDEGPEARAAGLREILRRVLVKVSGSRSVLEASQLPEVLDQAASLVQQFRYRRPAETGGEGDTGLLLWARFDPEGLNRLLQSKGIAVWRGRRPAILLWLAEERGLRRVLLDPSEEPSVARAIRETAAGLGMSLTLPLLDLQDRSAITPADLWADYGAAIREASARYPHDLVLIGRLRRFDDGRWAADWSLWREEGVVTFSGQGDNREDVLRMGLEAVQDHLAAQYRLRATPAKQAVLVRVEGVDSLAAYGRLMQWLRSTEGLRDIRIRAADGAVLILALVGEDPAGMFHLLDESLWLRPLPAAGGDAAGVAGLPVARVYGYAGGP